MVLAGNMAKRHSLVNHTTKTIHHHHHQFHLKQPGFTYSACGPFTKDQERIQTFRETGILKHLYRNKLDKACFAHDAA